MSNLEDPVRTAPAPAPTNSGDLPCAKDGLAGPPLESGGREGPEPTRYGDWELRGRCIDF